MTQLRPCFWISPSPHPHQPLNSKRKRPVFVALQKPERLGQVSGSESPSRKMARLDPSGSDTRSCTCSPPACRTHRSIMGGFSLHCQPVFCMFLTPQPHCAPQMEWRGLMDGYFYYKIIHTCKKSRHCVCKTDKLIKQIA